MLPLAVTSAQQPAMPNSSPSASVTPRSQSVQGKVSFAQSRMSADHDRRHRAKTPLIKSGDFVRIKLPIVSHKLAPKYSEPRAVVKAVGNTVWLQNGQRWNVRRCLLYRSILKQPAPEMTSSAKPPLQVPSSMEEDVPVPVCMRVPHQQPQQLRRSQRRRRAIDFGPVISH